MRSKFEILEAVASLGTVGLETIDEMWRLAALLLFSKVRLLVGFTASLLCLFLCAVCLCASGCESAFSSYMSWLLVKLCYVQCFV